MDPAEEVVAQQQGSSAPRSRGAPDAARQDFCLRLPVCPHPSQWPTVFQLIGFADYWRRNRGMGSVIYFLHRDPVYLQRD